jgi:tetratricopeptide (TPR) repeat protein
VLGIILLNSGEEADGLRYIHEALSMGIDNGDLQVETFMTNELAKWQVSMGKAEEALVRVEPLVRRLRDERWSASYPVLAEALLAAGRIDEARRELDFVRKEGFNFGVGGSRYEWTAHFLPAAAQLAILDGRWEDAEHDLEEALTTIRSRELPFEEAHVLSAHGRFHAARGETDRARVRFEEALAIYRRLGARVRVQRLEDEVAALPSGQAGT